MKTPTVLLTLLFTASTLHAQQPATPPDNPSQLPNAPQPVAQHYNQAYEGIVLGAFCGTGAGHSSIATRPTVGCGAGMNFLLYLPFFFEFGVMGPQADSSYVTGYLSFDLKIPPRPVERKYLPVLILGYSRLFETGNALDYGIALAISRKPDDGEPRSLQIELRDYYTFASPNQHMVMLRVGWLVGASD